MRAGTEGLDLRVRLLGDPCLWCWEIIDQNRDGAVVQSSWASEWKAYETREAALSAGCGRLAGLRRAGGVSARERRKGESAA